MANAYVATTIELLAQHILDELGRKGVQDGPWHIRLDVDRAKSAILTVLMRELVDEDENG